MPGLPLTTTYRRTFRPASSFGRMCSLLAPPLFNLTVAPATGKESQVQG